MVSKEFNLGAIKKLSFLVSGERFSVKIKEILKNIFWGLYL
jgi:hypothetical protein